MKQCFYVRYILLWPHRNEASIRSWRGALKRMNAALNVKSGKDSGYCKMFRDGMRWQRREIVQQELCDIRDWPAYWCCCELQICKKLHRLRSYALVTGSEHLQAPAPEPGSLFGACGTLWEWEPAADVNSNCLGYTHSLQSWRSNASTLDQLRGGCFCTRISTLPRKEILIALNGIIYMVHGFLYKSSLWV